MIKLNRPLIVEGRYDKAKLSSLVEGVIITTGGFDIFSDREKLRMIRLMADDTGIIILTDSDVAGFRIRSFLKGAVNEEKIIHVYIPDVYGKEKRKPCPSKEGKLGVEGIDSAVLLRALEAAGAVDSAPASAAHGQGITKADLFEMGLSGGPGSRERRLALLKKLGLPRNMSANALLPVLNLRYTLPQLRAAVEEMYEA